MTDKQMVEQIVDRFSRCLIGKLLKRIELFGDTEQINVIKKECKELVYEEIRTLKRVFAFYLFKEGREECIFFGKEKEDEKKGQEGRTE